MTYEEIGSYWNISQSRVRQILTEEKIRYRRRRNKEMKC